MAAPSLTPDAGIMSSGSVARVASSSVRPQWCESQPPPPVSDAGHLMETTEKLQHHVPSCV